MKNYPAILHFLAKHRICTLSVLLPDGVVHGATIHYSHSIEPLCFYFNTKKSTRKCLPLLNGQPTSAAVVIGFSEEEFIEIQMSGEVKMLSDETEIARAKQLHFTKYPDYQKYENDPDRVFLCFTPRWYRYSEFRAEPKVFVEEKI